MSHTTIHHKSLLSEVERLGSYIGNTPLYPVRKLHQSEGVKIFAKVEWQQFGGSVKARPAYGIVRDAIREGSLTGSEHLLDATSGNTGIAYAHMAAALDLPITLCLPENASEERKKRLKALGVEICYTSRSGGTDEAQEKARELAASEPGKYYYADQYGNESNWRAHFETTGPEVIQQTDGEVTHFVAGLGTTGTFMGTGRRLRSYNEHISLVGLQPDLAMHGLEGWKHMETANTPEIYDAQLADEHRSVSTEKAYEYVKKAAREEGLLLSPSSAANLAGAVEVANEIEEGIVVTVFPDDASKYREIMEQLF